MCFNFITDSFSQFDYGPSKNKYYYNSTCPPTYDLTSIQVPITLIYGKNDILADEEVSYVFFFCKCSLSQYFDPDKSCNDNDIAHRHLYFIT